jgi:putative sigma-54 modulation protein
VRKQVEHGLAKLSKILGPQFTTNVILTSEKYRHIAEITVTVRNHAIVAVVEDSDSTAAVNHALDRIERQALKYKDRWRTRKRRAKKPFEIAEGAAQPAMARRANGHSTVEEAAAAAAASGKQISVVVHSFPGNVRTPEPHVVPADDCVALRPMTLEEAVKEAEFRDRDVFVFRDSQGHVKVLHRTKDGKLQLIEA